MAKFVATNSHLTVNGVDLSDHVENMTLNYEAEAGDVTAMQDLTRIMVGGLKNWSLDVNFRQNFAASEVDATLFSIVGTVVTVALRADAGATSATNPQFSGSALVQSYNPITSSVGDVADVPVTFVSAGTLSRATS